MESMNGMKEEPRSACTCTIPVNDDAKDDDTNMWIIHMMLLLCAFAGRARNPAPGFACTEELL